MTDDLRTRIAKVLHSIYGPSLGCAEHGWDREPSGLQEMYLNDADAVIRELPELGRIAKVTEVCMASLDLDSRVGTALSDRQWLAETILNVLNGAADE